MTSCDHFILVSDFDQIFERCEETAISWLIGMGALHHQCKFHSDIHSYCGFMLITEDEAMVFIILNS